MERSIAEDGRELVYSCGCRFAIDENDELVFSADTHDPKNTINFSCPETYRVLADFAQGVFQLESPLGKSFVKKLKPENLEHIGALGSILRPGSLENKDENGISTTEHYVKKKNGLEEVKSYHPVIDNILSGTYNEMIYQEQAMEIAKECAGFTLMDADMLRKAIGKKIPEEMAKCKVMFLEGAKKAGVLSDEQAIEVFGWIEKSQRYSFNKCLAGGTIINDHGGSRTYTIKEIYNVLTYKKWKDPEVPRLTVVRNYQKNGYIGWGMSLGEEGKLVKNKIIKITYSGHLEVFRVTTEDGLFIDLTKNHKLPTDSGEKLLADLVVGDRLYSKLSRKLDTSLVKVVSIEPLGVQDTYDVKMASPYHTLVVNGGLVVCNSHAVAYGITGYICAYIKTHFPLQFYTAWFKEENDRSMYKELASEAKTFAGIGLYTPNLKDLQEEFYWKDGKCES